MNNEPSNSKKASLPVRILLTIGLFTFAMLLTIGLFVPDSPLSGENLGSASGGSRGGYAPEMTWIVIPLFFWMSYRAGKEAFQEIKAKRQR